MKTNYVCVRVYAYMGKGMGREFEVFCYTTVNWFKFLINLTKFYLFFKVIENNVKRVQ